jgi:beta-galactosidase
MAFPQNRFTSILHGFPHLLHGGDYNPEQWIDRPDILEQDQALMPRARCNAFSINIFGWATLEPREGVFDFDHLDRTFERIASFGGRVILATPSGARAPWIHTRYPSTARVDRMGRRDVYRDRHNHCWTSPEFRRLVRTMNQTLAERYAAHPALAMWHISNELNGECYCDLCRDQFARWLERRYGTVDAMNQAWWTAFWSHRYDRFDQPDPRDICVDGLQVDWRRFNTWQVCDWIDFECVPLRQLTPDVPVTTNLMGTYHPADYHAVARHVDVVCDDQYPAYDVDSPGLLRAASQMGFRNDLMRSMQAKPFFLMECSPSVLNWLTPAKLKRPGQHLLEMTQALAHGADGTMYFQWRAGRGASEKLHGAVVDHNSSPETRVFKDVARVGERLAKLGVVVGTMPDACVAIVYDWESKWAIQSSSGPDVSWSKYDEVAVDHYDYFFRSGVAVDVIPMDRDLSKYKLVILPQTWIVTESFGERLRDFVRAGGTLVVTHDSGVADTSNRIHQFGWPGCGLQDVLGLSIEEVDRTGADHVFPLRAVNKRMDGPNLVGRDVKALANLRGACALIEYADDFMAGHAAVAVNAYGQGKGYFVGTRLSPAVLDRFYSSTAGMLPRSLDAALPPGFIVSVRGAGDERFLFAMNFNRAAQTVHFSGCTVHDLETGDTYHEAFTLDPLGSRVFRQVLT